VTNILALPELSIPCTIRTNEDWLDAVAFWDVNGNPVALDGIPFELQARATADSGDVLLDATTDNGLLVLCSAGALVQPVAPGFGYAVGDVIYAAGGACTVPAALVVTALALVGLGVAGGTGYAVGDVLTLGGGVAAAPAMVMVDKVDANGAITASHVLAPGVYTAPATALAQVATTGRGTGATFTAPLWGVASAKMTSAGTYSVLPTSPVAQGSTTGLGAGATFALTWVNNALCIAVPLDAITDYLIAVATVYEIRAEADGYTRVVVTGPLTVVEGIVR
jgi:hypothetical protein